jgi:hypothetical protein
MVMRVYRLGAGGGGPGGLDVLRFHSFFQLFDAEHQPVLSGQQYQSAINGQHF